MITATWRVNRRFRRKGNQHVMLLNISKLLVIHLTMDSTVRPQSLPRRGLHNKSNRVSYVIKRLRHKTPPSSYGDIHCLQDPDRKFPSTTPVFLTGTNLLRMSMLFSLSGVIKNAQQLHDLWHGLRFRDDSEGSRAESDGRGTEAYMTREYTRNRANRHKTVPVKPFNNCPSDRRRVAQLATVLAFGRLTTAYNSSSIALSQHPYMPLWRSKRNTCMITAYTPNRKDHYR